MNGPQIFLLNLISTWYMVGLIWMVQIVHYKMFDRVGAEQFVRYEADHNRLITPVVGLPMLVEITTAVALLYVGAELGFPAGRSGRASAWSQRFGFPRRLLQVPCHQRLMSGFDEQAYQRLVATNWIRTILWSARGGLLTYFAAKMLG